MHGADFYANKKHKGSECKEGDKDGQHDENHGDQNSPEGSPNSEGSNMTNPGSLSSPSIKSEVIFLVINLSTSLKKKKKNCILNTFCNFFLVNLLMIKIHYI